MITPNIAMGIAVTLFLALLIGLMIRDNLKLSKFRRDIARLDLEERQMLWDMKEANCNTRWSLGNCASREQAV